MPCSIIEVEQIHTKQEIFQVPDEEILFFNLDDSRIPIVCMHY